MFDVLESSILSILNGEDAYGYKLTQDVKALLNISESTLYPVLRRLERDNLVEVYDSQYAGRNRRYYRITKLGKTKLKEYRKSWVEFSTKIDNLLIKGDNNE